MEAAAKDRTSPPAAIADPADPRLAVYTEMRAKSSHRVFAQGVHVVRRALQSRHRVCSVVGTASHLDRLAADAAADTPLFCVASRVLDEVVGFALHRGVVAHVATPVAPPWPPEQCARVLVLERLADPANLGAALRNARAFGVDAVVCDARGAWAFERRCLRASTGHAFHLPVHCVEAVTAVRDLVQRHGARLQVVAACADATATPIEAFDFATPGVLLVGNEGDGLSPDISAMATARVMIPMHPEVDSLNAAAATAVLLHHWRSGPR